MGYRLDFSSIWSNWGYIADGIATTLTISITAIVFGLIIGAVIAFARISSVRVIRITGAAYVELFRTTPLLVQLFVIAFGIPALGVGIPPYVAGVLGLSLNGGAYCAEIFRAGVISVPRGQTEAAQSLGFGGPSTFRFVIFPQALRRVMPPLGTLFLDTTLSSSFLSVIGAPELTQHALRLAVDTYRPIEVYAVVGLIYLIIGGVLGRIFLLIDPALNRRRNRLSESRLVGMLRGVR